MPSISRSSSAALALALLTSSGLASAQAPPKSSAPLPLKNVRLYETGVGYFERSGRVDATSSLSLPVPTSHLDDALKTLVVIGTDGKTSVAGVEFGSSITPNMGRALAGLPPTDSAITYSSLLRSLKGGSVELRTARESVRGRIVDVLEAADSEASAACSPLEANAKDAEKPAEGAATVPLRCVQDRQTTLLLLTTDAEVRRFRASEIVGVKATDPALAARLGAGLDAASAQGVEAPRKLRVMAQSTGDVTLGYVAEAPVWRSTYRMVLNGAADRGVLQGWALIHNDTDEEWKKVHVDLVNGRPDSFLFPLAAPRYGRRELITPQDQLSTKPQLLGQTTDSLWGDEVGDSFGAGGLGLSGIGAGGGGRGEGIGLGSIGTIGHGSGTGSGDGASTVLSVGDLAAVAQAEGAEAGALFKYSLGAPIDLRPHGSALVPFMAQSIAARRIVWFTAPGDVGRSAARVKNDTQQTLPAGTIAFFEAGGFAGEAMLERMKPGESRMLAFATELDVEIDTSAHATSEDTQLVTFEGEDLVEHYIRHHRIDYEIKNKSGGDRTVFLSLEFVRNTAVRGTDALDFDVATNKPLAVFDVAAKTQKVRRLEADEGLHRSHRIDKLTVAELKRMAASTKLPAAQRAAIEDATRALLDADARQSILPTRKAELAEVEADLARLRGYLSASKTGGDSERFVEQILKKEERMKELRTRIATLGTEVTSYRARARAALSKLTR
ncbi:hypothetical protein [Polyangium aurulentum]|uniref:hypothetical protein n=1 Tax=Polyangium aurulentum TaxID=2567896 RepID=UPI00146AF0DD|nr:hypothetical protein [Polyangium aurulentum]UQA62844.1 hypothetical protein E8A73_021280 [Polyangium aurulentum]